MSVDIANEKVISIQLAPFEILKQDGDIFVETQQHGPDKNTDGWGVYKRYSRGMVIHVIDAKTEEDGKLLAGKVAEENGVGVEPYPWLVEKASKNVETNRIMFPTSMESQVEKQTAYLNTLRDLVRRAFKDGVVLGIDSPENPTKDPMPENYKVYMQVGSIDYQEDSHLELPLSVRTTTIARISADRPDGKNDFNKHYLGQYIPNPVVKIADYQREYSNNWIGDPGVQDQALVSKDADGNLAVKVPEGMINYNPGSKAFTANTKLAELYAKRSNPDFTFEDFQKELDALIEEYPNEIGTMTYDNLDLFARLVKSTQHAYSGKPVENGCGNGSQSEQMAVRPTETFDVVSIGPDLSEELTELMTGAKDQDDFNTKMEAFCAKYPGVREQITAVIESMPAPTNDSDEALLKDLIAKTKVRQAVVANELVQVLIDQVDVLKPAIDGTILSNLDSDNTHPLSPWSTTGDSRKQMYRGNNLKTVVGTTAGESAFSEGSVDYSVVVKKPELPGSAEPQKRVDPLEQALDRAIKDHDTK